LSYVIYQTDENLLSLLKYYIKGIVIWRAICGLLLWKVLSAGWKSYLIILTNANGYQVNKAGDGIKVASTSKSNKNALKASAFNY
jgi:hypothetical protein